MPTSLSLLGLFAHPDDEQLMSGAFAMYGSQGVRTGLICATRGECGEIADPAVAKSTTRWLRATPCRPANRLAATCSSACGR